MAKRVTKVLDIMVGIATDPGVQKMVLGQYTDGTPRTIVDAMNGEFKSPETLRKEEKKRKHKKKKKHDKKKDFLDDFFF